MQDVKGLKVLQVLPDGGGGRTKSLFELCLNFRITISPLENWPPGLIVFEKKKKQIWIITALGFLYSCCNINEDKQNAKCSDKGAKNITCQQICIKKTNLQNFSNFSKEIFLESEFHLTKSERCWLWEWSYIGGTVHNVSNSIEIQRSLFAARVWKLFHLPWKQNEETSCFLLQRCE